MSDAAIYQAQKNDSVITGINVIPKIPNLFKNTPPYSPEGQKEEANIMKESTERSLKNDVKFQEKIISRSAGSDIVKFTEDNDFDLITIRARGIGSVKETFLGSVSHYISHRSKVPVLIIK